MKQKEELPHKAKGSAKTIGEIAQQEMETIYEGFSCRPISTETIRLLQADRIKLFDFGQYENIAGFYLVYCFEEAVTQTDIRGS